MVDHVLTSEKKIEEEEFQSFFSVQSSYQYFMSVLVLWGILVEDSKHLLRLSNRYGSMGVKAVASREPELQYSRAVTQPSIQALGIGVFGSVRVFLFSSSTDSLPFWNYPLSEKLTRKF